MAVSRLHPSPPLSYIYSGTLPANATVTLAQELLAAISTNPKLDKLADLCKAFIGSYDLKQRMNFVLFLVHELAANCLHIPPQHTQVCFSSLMTFKRPLL